MAYVKNDWENLPAKTTPISAARLAHMETQYDEAVAYVDDKLSGVGDSFNVMDFGAVGDGVSDDSNAFKSALQAVQSNGGGVLFLPPGKTYWCSRRIELVDNLIISGYGATMVRRAGVSEEGYTIFRSKYGAGPGYGAGGKNISCFGVTFKGSLDPSNYRAGNAFSLHHVDNFTMVDCFFDELQGQGHCVDLQACRNAKFFNTRMRGVGGAAGGYLRSEAIQIGPSRKGGESAPDPEGDFDDLPCRDILVQGVISESADTPWGRFPAPNPVGSHDSVYLKGPDFNVTVRDVSVFGPRTDTSSPTAGVIHFVGVDGLVVDNLSVVFDPEALNTVVVGVYSGPDAPLGSVNISNVHISGVVARNNRPVILRQRLTGETSIRGDFRVQGVYLSGGDTALASSNVIHVIGSDKTSVSEVSVEGAFRTLYAQWCNSVIAVSVSARGPARTQALNVTDTTNVSILGCDIGPVTGVDAVGLARIQSALLADSTLRSTSGQAVSLAAITWSRLAGCHVSCETGNAVRISSSPAAAKGVLTGNVWTIPSGTPAVVSDASGVVEGLNV